MRCQVKDHVGITASRHPRRDGGRLDRLETCHRSCLVVRERDWTGTLQQYRYMITQQCTIKEGPQCAAYQLLMVGATSNRLCRDGDAGCSDAEPCIATAVEACLILMLPLTPLATTACTMTVPMQYLACTRRTDLRRDEVDLVGIG